MPGYEKGYLADFVENSVKEAYKSLIGEYPDFDFAVDLSKKPEFGDYATNIAIIGARKLGKDPIEFAKDLGAEIMRLNNES